MFILEFVLYYALCGFITLLWLGTVGDENTRLDGPLECYLAVILWPLWVFIALTFPLIQGTLALARWVKSKLR